MCSARRTPRRPCGRRATARWRDAPVCWASDVGADQLGHAAQPLGVRTRTRAPPAAAGRRPARSSPRWAPRTSRGRRRARPGSGSPPAPRAGSASCSSEPSSASRRTRHCTSAASAAVSLDTRLGVHDPHLDRAQPRLQAHVPPQERGLGDGVAAQQHVDGLDVVVVGLEAARRAGAREGVEDRDARRGEPAVAALPERRVGRQREQQRQVLAQAVVARGWPTPRRARRRGRAARRSARAGPARASRRTGTGSARRGRPRCPPTLASGCVPATAPAMPSFPSASASPCAQVGELVDRGRRPWRADRSRARRPSRASRRPCARRRRGRARRAPPPSARRASTSAGRGA